MATILNLETSTKVCSVALSTNGKIIAHCESEDEGYSHAEKLIGFIEKTLEQANKKTQEIDAISISKGPGSYTGLRIGTSTAKGLCYALSIPLIGINTLESLCYASQLSQFQDAYLVPMLDARRMEVYSGIFNSEKQLLGEIKPIVIDENSFAEELKNNRLIFFGNGAEKCKKIINHSNAQFVESIKTSAKHMVTLSHQKFEQNQLEDIAYFEPFYLKEFIAGKAKKLV